MIKVKPALKKKNSAKKDSKGSLQWDEDAIAEHDQLRGTRMKIEEPNTPFHYDDDSEDDDIDDDNDTGTARGDKTNSLPETTIDFSALQEKLTQVHQKEAKKEDFEQRRKQHYNEMEMIKQFRKQQEEHGDDEMEEDDDDG
mmetsp:Transcript_26423/g.39058  ORF Transcript_26423/g.39058 Transcript_26423/m.39058 type:complete len:141 (+) Transcript_26423:94-516(+)|eukprot:CAMPEP_0194225196 /NCGR_PEP_ID=MMETSP0156-20130528/39012_1 /TAXON_ID=33649 /ORGANISM="Thalassionema nitzschioides, Strain L26-B" /LENGTH=140 /DNA_ID=CAMNT_0038957049 /DNA_START=71 /DNA_END=493 /DNA_ORIENTATION=-